MAIDPKAIRAGTCYLLVDQADSLFLVLGITAGKVKCELRIRQPGGSVSYSLAVMPREQFARAVVRETSCR
jgi:hypothetical protein